MNIWTKALVQEVMRSGWIFKNEVEDTWLGNTEKMGGGEKGVKGDSEWELVAMKVSEQNVISELGGTGHFT